MQINGHAKMVIRMATHREAELVHPEEVEKLQKSRNWKGAATADGVIE